jgi:hypothetical protein
MMTKSFQRLTDKDLARLAKNPNNHVMQSVVRPPCGVSVALDEVARTVNKCWERVSELRAAYPKPTPQEASDVQKTLDTEFKSFAFTHPTFYAQIINQRTTQSHIDTMLYIIKVRQEDPSDEGKNKVTERLKKQFVFSREEYEQLYGKENTPPPPEEKDE